MSYKGNNSGSTKVEKDLKTHLLQSLQNYHKLGGSCDRYPSDVQYQTDLTNDENFLNVDYPSTVTSDIKDLQFRMTPGCQEITPSQCQLDAEDTMAGQYPTLSHKQLVESLDRLSTPPPSQLTHLWVRQNEGAVEMYSEEDVHYEDHVSGTGTQEEVENWDDSVHLPQGGNLEVQQHGPQLQSFDETRQPGADILLQIERSLHDHIDDELNSLRSNLHDLVADQQVHLRQYLTPTQYSEDVEDIDIVSNQEDFSGSQDVANLEDTGWSSDCMQSSCSTVNEPMKLEEASPDSAIVLQDDVRTCQQESVAIINRLTEESEIQAVLIQLQMSAAILSHTLRRQEYSTT